MTTLEFREIFRSLEEWTEFVEGCKIDLSQVEAKTLSDNLYYWLYNRYLGCAVAYETEDEFCAEIGIALQQYFSEALAKVELTKSIYKISNDELEILAENISNFSNNPNIKSGDPWKLLDYASQQTRGRQKAGKLIAYVNALRTMPDAQINYIIEKFDYLWLDFLNVKNEYLFSKK